MEIKEYDHVRIKSSGICGIVVDAFEKNGLPLFTIESDDRGVPGGFGNADHWKLYTCSKDELEKI